MKAFSTKSLRKNLVSGLRKFKELDEENAGLVECHNLVPQEGGLQVFDPIISLNANGVSWGGSVDATPLDDWVDDGSDVWSDDGSDLWVDD
jgi:hypothetical protein